MCRFPEMFLVEAVEGGTKVVSHPVYPRINTPNNRKKNSQPIWIAEENYKLS